MRFLPFYPVAIAVGYVIAVFTTVTSPSTDLVRPLLVASAVAIVIQVLATLLLRDRDVGALVAGIVIAAVPMLPFVFVALLAVLAFLTIPGWVARARGDVARPAPWRSATSLLNLVATIAVVIGAAQLLIDGRLAPPPAIATAIGPANPAAPDIYVILLDGHPRTDTLASEFDYDQRPFLTVMEAQGFQLAPASHSNYDMTELTFSSMFQMQQLPDIPAFAAIASGQTNPQQDTLLLANMMAKAGGFDELHKAGYEVVGIPSELMSDATPADRTLDSGQMHDFEIGLLTETRLRALAPDALRALVVDQHRDHIMATFEDLAGLARETAVHPRFVFAHVVSPHAPPVLGKDGAGRDGWACFPATCSFWVTGEPEGHEAEVTMMREEVGSVDELVLQATRSIVAASVRPAVILVMSDHGGRNDLTDRQEMLRSFFLARTPGHPGLFPADMTPVNLLPRLLNAYAGANLPLAPETSYWADLEQVWAQGVIDLVPVDPTDQGD